jgi:diguanylate cyclase (GGDEF)-like protein/PAS domain S-box-containing protein
MITDILKLKSKAFDYLFDAVVVTDLQGIIRDWNKGSEILYGYSKVEAIGQPVNILHVPEDSDLITSDVISAVEKHGKWTGDIRMLHKSGAIGWIESVCIPIYDSDNQMVGAFGINRDITERIKETERLEHLAHYDHLTKIPNRFLLLDRLEHLIAQSARNNSIFALLYIDLNKFKIINDTKGHAFGDQVLFETAFRLRQAIRSSDTVARIGGDEFVVLLENISDENDIALMVETLTIALNKTYLIHDEKFDVNCSIGVAIYPDDGTTSDNLLAIADKEMYKGKHQQLGMC